MEKVAPAHDVEKQIDSALTNVDTTRHEPDNKELHVTNDETEEEASSPPRTQNVAQGDVVDWDGDADSEKPMNWCAQSLVVFVETR
jgi:hypothetical protein